MRPIRRDPKPGPGNSDQPVGPAPISRHLFGAVAQSFLSAGSGDVPVPEAILETLLKSTVTPQTRKPALAADTLNGYIMYQAAGALDRKQRTA